VTALASALSLLLRSLSGQVSSLRITNIFLGLLALRRAFFFLALLVFFFTLSLRSSFELFFDHSALPLTLSLATANILASES
jgi:hypothetical protein